MPYPRTDIIYQFVYARSKGSGETAHNTGSSAHSLLADAISTKIARARACVCVCVCVCACVLANYVFDSNTIWSKDMANNSQLLWSNIANLEFSRLSLGF